MTLPFPVCFVHRDLQYWRDIGTAGVGRLPDPDEMPERFRNGRDCWVMQTYLHLARRGLNVRLADRFVPGALCVVHYDHLYLSDSPYGSFVVAAQADRPRASAADLRIVQNPAQVRGGNEHHIPHWPQPGLLPRDPARGTRLERVVYLGLPLYLAPRFRDDDFRRRLRELGMELVVNESDWIDYRTCDAVLAVREATEAESVVKPASKLVNAWRAGCPALLGPETAYRALRRGELDYVETSEPEQALAALTKLRDRPGLFAAMVENGRRRAAEFTIDRIADRWVELLAGPITDGYRRWLRTGRPFQSLFRRLRSGWRGLRHKLEREVFAKPIWQ